MSRIGERREHAQADPSAGYVHKRAAIVQAAARVFQRSGYERASMNNVAAEAGADRASVYYYFKDKRELFHAVIIDAVQHLVNEAGHIAAADMTAAGKVQALVAELMRTYPDHYPYPYLYVYVQEDMTELASSDVSSTTLRRLARRFTSAVEGMMAAGITSGEFKPGLDPELATNAVLGALNWSHRWFKPDRGATRRGCRRVRRDLPARAGGSPGPLVVLSAAGDALKYAGHVRTRHGVVGGVRRDRPYPQARSGQPGGRVVERGLVPGRQDQVHARPVAIARWPAS